MSSDRPKEVTCKIVGRQIGRERFEKSADAPRWAYSRGNVTCLSHAHNLYFVAQGEEIWVYEPSCPTQALGPPVLLLRPTPTGINPQNYFPHGRPGDINYLVVDFLGHKEILLLCTDCGDVFFYYTSRIYHAVQLALSSQSESKQPPRRPTPLRPDFSESVSVSAWGLSVHRESRKIAVSSNTHQITIFQFALAEPDEKCQDSEGPKPSSPSFSGFWRRPSDVTSLGELSDQTGHHIRQSNWRIKLPDTKANIPVISFCNTPEDPDGNFLAAGDINGTTMLWDLRNLDLECWTAHFCNKTRAWPRCSCLDGHPFNHAVWGLYWLNPKCFLKIGPTPEGLRQEAKDTVLDITEQRDTIPNASMNFKNSQVTTSTHGIRLLRSLANQAEDSDFEDDEEDADDDDDDDVPGGVFLTNVRDYTSRLMAAQAQPRPKWRFLWEFYNEETPQLPRAPFLWISSKQLALHQPRNEVANNNSDNKPGNPVVVMRNPLKQTVDWSLQRYFDPSWWAGRIQRMSMHALIPELGVLVAASSTGRCAVISLLQAEKDDGRPFYFYRIDCILPTQLQEDRGERPGFLLMGIAVGPVQGYIGEPKEGVARRWRLLLHYSDFSVLSYEIYRNAGDLSAET